jgi:uncharacterized membrane protein
MKRGARKKRRNLGGNALNKKKNLFLLGNTLSNNILKKVDILYEKQDGNEQLSDTVWTGQDELLKVSAIQQDLNKLQDFPNTYWFR